MWLSKKSLQAFLGSFQEWGKCLLVNVWELALSLLGEDISWLIREVGSLEHGNLEVSSGSSISLQVVLELVWYLSFDHFNDLGTLWSVTSSTTVLDFHVGYGVSLVTKNFHMFF